VTKRLYWLSTIVIVPLTFVHPFGPVRQQQSPSLMSGVHWDNPGVLKLFERACQNCHSERTRWPIYSYMPGLSWALEKDVADARRHMNLSRWGSYSNAEKQDLLARIGAEVRTRRMPLGRYTLLHPEARLSQAEIQAIYEWTKDQRRLLRSSGQ
jgi:cytochrome c